MKERKKGAESVSEQQNEEGKDGCGKKCKVKKKTGGIRKLGFVFAPFFFRKHQVLYSRLFRFMAQQFFTIREQKRHE